MQYPIEGRIKVFMFFFCWRTRLSTITKDLVEKQICMTLNVLNMEQTSSATELHMDSTMKR